jgi:hypothetical protein
MTKVVFRDAALDRFLNAPGGEVGEYLRKKGNQITVLAKSYVGVRTGALRSSIHMRHARDTRGQYVMIGSPLKHARMHHEGTKPHMIYPNKAKKLRFVSRGQVVYASAVRHPGTKANKYLVKALRQVI